MEANTLFHITFATPVLLFVLFAFIYTFLSWIIMWRKSRASLKNKEHTRLANVRFDIRCYFIFLLLVIGVLSSGYYYLRRAKIEDDASSNYGYIFVAFNSLLGLYMFIFHCIQDEKQIRREYSKYVRNKSWLPRCLRCSRNKQNSNLTTTNNGNGGTTPMTVGTLNSNNVAVSGNHIYNTAQLKTKTNCNEESGAILNSADVIVTEDNMLATSDCELNETQVRCTAAGTLVTPTPGDNITLKSGILPGNLMLQQQQHQQLPSSGNVLMDCGTNGSGSGSGSAATTGTLRSQSGLIGCGVAGGGNARTPSVGHASPTSSASSSQLMFANKHQIPTADAFYHQPDLYNWKQGNKHARQNGLSPQHYPTTPQTHEFFYWTQKHNPQGKKKRGNNTNQMPDSPSGSLHSRNTAAGSQILFYPSYKKTTVKPAQSIPAHAQYAYGQYAEAIDPYYQQQQQHQRHLQQQYYQQQQQQQQMQNAAPTMSSDDEQAESHAQLLHLNSRRVAQQQQQQQQSIPMQHYTQHAYATADYVTEQRYHRNKHTNCDLSLQQQMTPFDGSVNGSVYNHCSAGSDANGPVYEEILSNRSSDVPQYDVSLHEQNQQQQQHRLATSKHRTNRRRRRRRAHADNEPDEKGMESESACDDLNGDIDDQLELNNELNNDMQHVADLHDLARADERMRRLMEIEDENFRRRFQRQQRKNTANEALKAPYHDFNGPSTPHFVGNAGVRNYKKTSPNARMAVNELFSQVAPPLPPANPFPPTQKRQTPLKQPTTTTTAQQQQQLQTQQQQQQQLSPINGGGGGSGVAQPQQPVGRNISAMLDENNTVRCYLEPLNNK